MDKLPMQSTMALEEAHVVRGRWSVRRYCTYLDRQFGNANTKISLLLLSIFYPGKRTLKIISAIIVTAENTHNHRETNGNRQKVWRREIPTIVEIKGKYKAQVADWKTHVQLKAVKERYKEKFMQSSPTRL